MTDSHSSANPNFVLFGMENNPLIQNIPFINPIGIPTAQQRLLPLSLPVQPQMPMQNTQNNVISLVSQLPITTPLPAPFINNQPIPNNYNIQLPGVTESIMNPGIRTKVTQIEFPLPLNTSTQTFNMNVQYKGQLAAPSIQLPDLNLLEDKIKHIDKLSNEELSDRI